MQGDDLECLCCGWCCLQYRGLRFAQRSDLLRWFDEGRSDILRHLSIPRREGLAVSCNSLSREELERVPFADFWVDPRTGVRLECCPFLEPASGRLLCRIQETKPEICRNHRPREWLYVAGPQPGCRAACMTQHVERIS
ncbi:MAG: hypothetical protein QMD46_01805 [Methanomicrobiales archaeon]|nr:hypothetical protein [Methanomicrobiales archaeon]MDI6875176.1 hypothetical protein [Methanomicrobiales archaeon]